MHTSLHFNYLLKVAKWHKAGSRGSKQDSSRTICIHKATINYVNDLLCEELLKRDPRVV